MPGYARLRKKVLMEVYHRSDGDTNRPIKIVELAHGLNLPVKDVVVLTQQLEGKGWIEFTVRTLDPEFSEWRLAITMHGIETAEKMERGILRRFYEDHFALAGILFLILSVVLNRLVDLLLRALGWQ